MKRILICATQVPFVRGGAELLVDGLRDALRERGHRVDVVSLPFAWQPHELIGRAALAWRLLDLRSVNDVPIDQVICTKFPSYAVNHPRKVVWLVHQHRQAYDWYGTPFSDFANTPEDRATASCCCVWIARALGEAQRRYTISNNVGARLQALQRAGQPDALPAQPLRRRAARRQLWRLHSFRRATRRRQTPRSAAARAGAHRNAAALRIHQHRAGARAA